ncbi:MAG: creatininase family protein [bacterium]
MYLKELKATDFQENQKYNFLFPIGATEQHGPFIPFGTDTYITDYIIEHISKDFPEIIILPTLEFSRSQEHRGFYGTLWLTEETLERVISDICNSLKDNAKYIFFYSFHANGIYINRFIQKYSFENIKIINLEESNDEDEEYIKKNILHGPLD